MVGCNLMIEKLKCLIWDTVIEANRKLTPSEVEKIVARAAAVHRQTVKVAIKELVSRGELTYTYLFGASYLEKSFDRPVRISKRIVIKPPEKAYRPEDGDLVIDLAKGAAFGDGAHPTTSLVLRALDAIFGDHHGKGFRGASRALDVGTGTGVLAIALAKLGVQEVIGVDIDPCAVSEASHNVALNGLAGKVKIMNTPFGALETLFPVVVANLAYPTLRRLSPHLSKKMEPEGVLILSGFKEAPSKDLGETYAEQGLSLIRKETDREWVCLVFRKPAHL